MNKIFKTIWNSVRRCLVVVNEATKSASQRGSTSGSFTDERASFTVETSKKPLKGTFEIKYPLVVLACVAMCGSSYAYSVSGTVDHNIYNDIGRYGATIVFNGNTLITADQYWDITAGTVFQVNSGVTVTTQGINLKTYCRHGCDLTMSIDGTFILDANSSYTSAGGSSRASYINNGGRLVLKGNFTANPGLYVRSGGTVESKASNFFNNVQSSNKLTTYLMNVINEQGAKTTVDSNSYGRTTLTQTVGALNKSVSNQGTFIFYDIAEGTAAANAIRAALGGNVQFTGKNTSGEVGAFDVALMNTLIREGKVNLIFYDRDLQSSTNLTLGSGSGSSTYISGSNGFRSLPNAKNIAVTDNKTLTLIGNGSTGYNLTAANSQIDVTNALLSLGHSALSSNGGHLYGVNLSNGGNLSVAKGSYAIDTLTGGKTISNAGTLTISNLNQADSVIYTQTAGTITTGNGWFDQSTLNLNGGSLERSELGANTVNINGANVVVGTLGSSTNLNMSNGSLQADQLALNKGGVTYNQTGGTLTTKQDSLFENVNFSVQDGLNTISLNSTVPEEVKTSLSDFFQKYVPGNLTQEIIDHASFTGGKVVITGVNLTTTMRDDLTQAFKDTFGDKTQIVFEGNISGVSQNDVLNTAKVNELADNHVLNDVIFVDRALEGEGQSVVIGNAGVKNSTGFTSVNNAKDVTITDGKNLVLIGAKQADFNLSSSTVTASGDGSKLTLGTLGLADGNQYQGNLQEVLLRGGAGLEVVNGSYAINDLTARDSTKTRIDIRKPASLTVDSVALMTGSALKNEGIFHVTNTMEGLSNAVIENAEGATMTVDGKTSIIGRLTNNGNFTARDEVAVNGTLTNNGDATIGFFKVLGAVNNTGTINTSETSFVNGQLTNTGTIKLYNTTNIDKFSELTNVKDLTAEGTVTMNGQLGNLSNADFETLKVAGTGSEFTNHGTLVIDELTLTDGAYAINGGAMKDKYTVFGLFRARPTEQIRDLNVGQGTQKTNAGLGYYAQGTIDGIFTNTKDGETFFGTSDVHVDGQGIAIGTNGQVQNAGTITFGGSLVNAGSIAGDGKIIFKHEGASTNVFSNSGTINVGSLEANDITYEHTGGSIASANGWFENSQINVKGGEMSHASLGSGNTYTVGLTGTQNQVATLTIDKVTSDSEVNIIEGGKFVAKEIALTEDKKTVHLSGGTLSTTLNQIFDDVFYKALDIDAENPDDQVDIEGVKVATGVSGVIDSIKKGIEFGWGTVAFDDASYSASMAADVLQKLDEVDTDPQGHEGQLEVAFNGKAAQSFNVDLANSVVAKDPEGQKTYATFANEELTNEVAASNGYKALYVGHEDTDSAITQPLNKDFNKLHTSIGFKGVRNVSEGLYIGDGYHLVLVGEDSNSVDANKYELADGAVYVTGGSKGNALGDPSTLTLGSYGTANKTAGHLSQLYVGVSVNDLSNAESNGQVRVRHGDFTIDTLTNGGVVLIGGDGKNGLRDDREASLTVKNYVDNGYYTLDGQLTTNYANFNIEKLSMGAGKGQGSLVNRGTMSIKEGTYNGLIDNHGTLTVGNLTIQNGAVGGQVGNFALVNNTDAKMVADNLTIAGDGTWGSGAEMRGGMTNAGTLTVNENMTVEGTFDNTGNITANVFTVNDGGDVNNLASGSMTIDALAFNGGAFDNAGTVNLVQSKGNSTIASAFNNTGKLTVAEGDNSLNIAANGSITNDGTIDAKGKVSVAGGTLTNNKTATFDDLDITSGQVIVNAGSSFKDTGTTSVNMANKSDVAIDNKSDLELSDLDLNKGTISGGTMHVADANVATDGVIEQVMGFFEKLVNAGTVNLTGGDVNGLNNTGTLTSSGDITLAGTSSGSITVDGTLGIEQNETLTSTGTLIANSNSSISGTLEAHGQSTLKGDTTVADGGKLSANGTFNAATVNVNQGGLLASAGTSNIDHVNAQANSTINVDGGLLHLGELHASNVTYNQTDGTITSDKGWFTDSTLNISGGHLDANQIKDETGKVTGSLGHNTVNISGRNPMPSINDEDTPENKSHWKDNLTVVNADVVTSDTTININAGGVLDVDDLQLTAPDSITVAGGGLQTSLDEIFDWVKTEVIKIDAEDPDSGVIELPTDVLVSTTVGDVQDSIKEGINFESGMIAFDDEHFSYSTLISAGQQFGEAFADSNVTLHFLGNMAEKFTIDTADKLIAEGLPEVLHGIVLDTTTLHNTSLATGDTNKNLVIGGTADGANSIGINMGFKDVANADNITIEGGKEFALVGNQRPQDFDWTTGYDDSNKLLVDAADGGSVTINNGTFTMGSDGVRNPTIGWVNSTDIGANGTLVVKNGEFADWTINNAGTINVNKNGTLHTNELTNTNKVNVAGSLTVENLNNANGTITNIGSILVSGTNDLNGTINNGGTFEALGQVTISGNYTSDKNGKNIFEDLTVSGVLANAGELTIKGNEGVNDDEFKLTIAQGGKLENAGTINNTHHDTKVEGKLINGGKAYYDDMTIVAGGISNNLGYEKGDILTVDKDGKHTNSGVSIWNTVDVSGVMDNLAQGEGHGLVIGSEDSKGNLTIAQGGTLNNGSQLDATHVENTKIEGLLTNTDKGVANYDDMTIVAGGVSNNAGFEKGDILTVDKDGKHTNSGVSIWNTVDVSGVMDNLAQGENQGLIIGSEDSKGNLTIAQGGSFNNGSQLDATNVENTKVEGLLTNTDKGVANYDDMTIVAGGTSTNNGYEKGDILNVGGQWNQNGESHWNNIVITDGGETSFGQDSKTEANKVTVDGGIFQVNGGDFIAHETELNKGMFVVGNHEELSEDNKASFVAQGNTTINTDSFVIGNGNLVFGTDRDFGPSIGLENLPDHPSRVTVGSTVTIGAEGSLAVGQGTYTDKDNFQDIGNGNLFFGEDSTTIIHAGQLGLGNAAFKTEVEGSTVTVEGGATLVMGGIRYSGDYLITDGFDHSANAQDGQWLGGWTEDNLYALPQDGSGIGWILDMFTKGDQIWVNAQLEDVQTVYPDISIPNISNDAMNQVNPEDMGDKLIQDTLRDNTLSVEEKTHIINSVAEINYAGGAMVSAFGDLDEAMDSIDKRLSFTGEHFNQSGSLIRGYKGGNLWVDITGGMREVKDLEATGNMKGGQEADTFGFIIGADYTNVASTAVFGGAIAYTTGSQDATGDWSKTTTDTTSVGLHAYAAWTPNDRFNVVSSMVYQMSNADSTQTIGAAGFGKAEADMDTNLFAVGVRGEYRHAIGNTIIVPHVGARVIHAQSDAFDSKVDGQKTFNHDADATTTFQMPIGVSVRGEFNTQNGWNVRPQGDFSVIPQFGDVEQTTTVQNVRGVTDDVTGEFAGKFVTKTSLGVQAQKGQWNLGVEYGMTAGDSTQNHSFKLKARYHF